METMHFTVEIQTSVLLTPSRNHNYEGWLVGFYSVSTLMGYLTPNPVLIHTHIYIYVCVCVCVWLGSSRSFKHVSYNNKNKFCLYNFIKILSSFLINVLVSG